MSSALIGLFLILVPILLLIGVVGVILFGNSS